MAFFCFMFTACPQHPGTTEWIYLQWFTAAGAYDKPASAAKLGQFLDEHKGWDVNQGHADRGITALGWCSEKGDAKAVQLLLSRGANVNRYSSTDSSQRPLYWAAYYGHSQVIRALAAAGAKVTERNGNSELPTLLFTAAQRNHEYAVHVSALALLSVWYSAWLVGFDGAVARRWLFVC